ncbi:MAG: nucleotidyl transferase AbiEii/AbiGii toxin family protein [Desulfobacterales bacterium]|nr:nucleotidyl transferase AbiEii/AbiGii toxin family protein [Desulfobacterales bacterium]
MNLKEVLKTLIAIFNEQKIDFVLSGGLALSTMNIFRFTKDIDFLIFEEAREKVHEIMIKLGYELQDFSSTEIISYLSPLRVFGQVDFLLAKRKYTKAMMRRAAVKDVFNGDFQVKTLRIEDLIGLKIQAIFNDPENRYLIDAPDIQRLLSIHQNNIDLDIIREYFKIFDKEALLDDWLSQNK